MQHKPSEYLQNIDEDKVDLITGERIVRLCDVAFFTEDYLVQFPAMRKYVNTLITPDDLTNQPRLVEALVQQSFTFFTKIDWLTDFKKGVLPLIHSPFILVTHNSDHLAGVDEDLLQNPFLVKWYGQNMMPASQKTRGIPIGLENPDVWGRTNVEHLLRCRGVTKTKLLYFQFSDYSNKARPNIRQTLRTKGFVENAQKNWLEYISELAEHKFCVAPPGNGVDTHRMWECIYLGVIPIAVRSPPMQEWFHGLPIMWVESYDEVTLASLKRFLKFSPRIGRIPSIARLSTVHRELQGHRQHVASM